MPQTEIKELLEEAKRIVDIKDKVRNDPEWQKKLGEFSRETKKAEKKG